jgi:hypothetical protein
LSSLGIRRLLTFHILIVSVNLAMQFQRRIKKKSSNQKQELPVVAMFVNESGQNEHSL